MQPLPAEGGNAVVAGRACFGVLERSERQVSLFVGKLHKSSRRSLGSPEASVRRQSFLAGELALLSVDVAPLSGFAVALVSFSPGLDVSFPRA